MRLPALVLVAATLLACGTSPAAPTPDPLAGRYKVQGGDAAMPNLRALADAFVQRHPGVRFDFDGTIGSDAGIALVSAGTIDIGMASRDLTAAEAARLSAVVVGVAGTGFATHGVDLVKNLTSAQLRGIYSGAITNWSALGGPSIAIIPLVREKNAPVRTTMEEYLFHGPAVYGAGVIEIPSGDEMRKTVLARAGALGLIGLHPSQPEAAGVTVLSVDGIAPTNDALLSGIYPIRRSLYGLYGPDAKPAIKAFIEFIRSPQGQEIIARFI